MRVNRTKLSVAALLVLVMILSTVFSMPVSVTATVNDEDEDVAPLAAEYTEQDATVDGATEPTGETEPETTSETSQPTDVPEVGAVTGLVRTSKQTNRIALSWDSVAGASGYNLYYRCVDSTASTLTRLTSTGGTAIGVGNLNPGMKYQFRVAAYVAVDGQLYEGEPMTITTATNPNNVSGFKLKYSASYITVKWSKTSYVDGYVIYRKSAESNSQYVKYKTVGKDITEFSDKKVSANCPYYYHIYGYRKSSSTDIVYSLKYAEIKAIAGLTAPTDSSSTTRLNRILLSWNKSKYAKGYDIYYSRDNKTFKYLASTSSNHYYSGKLNTGYIYYMRVYPYRYVGSAQTKVRGTYFAKTFKINNCAYGKDPGSTYIEVSLRKQHMWMYVNNELYVSTDIVTGNYGTMDTPKGFWSINSKSSPCTLTGPGYTSYVNYWMAFIGSGYGIHDASWRSSFGGSIYKGNGSHGCINTPYKNVKKMYQKAKVGTPVIVYY